MISCSREMSVESGNALKQSQGRGTQTSRLLGIRREYDLNLLFNRFDQTPALPPAQSSQPPCSSMSLSTIQVSNQLRKMKVKKATGPDEISSRLLKSCTDQLCRIVEYIFNIPWSSWSSSVFALWWVLFMVPLQFAYQPGISGDDAIISLLDRSHMERPGSTVRIMFL